MDFISPMRFLNSLFSNKKEQTTESRYKLDETKNVLSEKSQL